MSIPNKRARKVRPTHPGEMLRADFLPDYGLSGTNRMLKKTVSKARGSEAPGVYSST